MFISKSIKLNKRIISLSAALRVYDPRHKLINLFVISFEYVNRELKL